MFLARTKNFDPTAIAAPPRIQPPLHRNPLRGGAGDFYEPYFVRFPDAWKRPPVKVQIRHGGTFVCMLTDVTYSSTSDRPIVELHAVNEDGNSVLVNCFNFLANFYVGIKAGESVGSAVGADIASAPSGGAGGNTSKKKKDAVTAEGGDGDDEASIEPEDSGDEFNQAGEEVSAEEEDDYFFGDDTYEGPNAASLPYVERGRGQDAPAEVREEAARLMIELEACLKEKLKSDKHIGKRNMYIEHWILVQRKSILCYTPQDSWMVRLYMNSPKHVPKARQLLESGRVAHMGHYTTYEANVRFDLRFLVDKNLHGCQWFEVQNTRAADPYNRRSRAQIELDAEPQDIVPLPIERADIAPLRKMSYDIECVPYAGGGGFPEAQKDPIICIGVTVEQGGQYFKVAFCLVPERGLAVDPVAVTEDGIPVETYTFWDERDLIANFIAFINHVDPDMMVGYNINGFDDPYIINRSEQLAIKKDWVNDFSRLLHRACHVRATIFKSKAFGTKKSFLLPLVGRINYDLYVHYQRNAKLPFYSLNYVSEKYLNDRKEDVPHFMLYGL